MKEFQVGDKIYYPTFSTGVLEIEHGSSNDYPLQIKTPHSTESFTEGGRVYKTLDCTGIVLATQENRELLEKLYGVAFQAPPSKTIAIHFEMPVKFKPTLHEDYWYINPVSDEGVGCETNIGSRADYVCIRKGVWRTKEEALVVADAIFGVLL